MVFYITGEVNKNIYDFINEQQVFKKGIKPYITADLFLNFIKKELRNLEVDYLIIDLLVLQLDEPMMIEEAIEAFKVLNKKGTIVISAVGEDEERREVWRTYCNNRYEFLYQEENLEEEMFKLLNHSTEELVIDNQSEELKNDDKETVKRTQIKKKVTKSNKEESTQLVKEESSKIEDSQPEGISPDKLYHKANVKVKTNDGQAISKNNSLMNEDQYKSVVNDKVVEEVINIPKKNKVITLDEYLLKNCKDKDETINWKCNNIFIGIVGTERKVGTTLASIQMANALAATSAKVSYTETNTHNHLQLIANEYIMEQIEDHYYKNSVSYYLDKKFDIEAKYNFILFDLGAINERTDWIIRIIEELINEVILVAGCKPYEQKALKYALSKLQGKNLHLLCNNATLEEYEQMNMLYNSDKVKCIEYKNETDLFSKNNWLDNISEILQEYRTE
ncbi:hypothetical protein [Anaeromicropila herbilytica]|uniref:Uncharacterized protein n=1 Tax=Anaeromicropila herbilytica TaxID=2785025 RepID=A0A7R7EIT6_9FIRM|nr:hypothetical protein [Anaeromicropila herbilytica]BCN29548.1 hypothetical protein bsdtb5_08430 [Anaeromicropila herbilytica]